MDLNLIEKGISKKTEPKTKLSIQPFWYAVYTRPHHEKKVDVLLKRENINSFLPLHSTLKQWSDRKKKVTEPLFSCYLFVNITMNEYYKVLNIPGVIRYISFEGKAVKIQEKQIQTIKNLLESNFELEESLQSLQIGNRVKIKYGTLAGMEGELVMHNNKKRVILRIEEINKSLFVNVPLEYLELIG